MTADGPDRVILYRCPVPTDVLCPCGKVARELRKAGIEPSEVRRVPLRKAHRDEVFRLTGQRHVPVLEANGLAVCDSKRIVEWIGELGDRSSEPAGY